MKTEKHQQQKKKNKTLKSFVKIAITLLLLWVVFNKITFSEIFLILKKAQWGYISLSGLLFMASQWVSSERLHHILSNVGLYINKRSNLLLYLQGMFYNLFIPGGIGGDGYKIYALNKQLKWPLKLTTAALLIDRVTGLFAMLVLLLIGGLALPLNGYEQLKNGVLIIGLLLSFISFFLGIKYLFPSFRGKLKYAVPLAFAVQSIQILCFVTILKSLHVESEYLLYAIVFLVSSILSIFSFSGIGVREIIFLKAALIFPFNENIAVSAGLLFSVITTIISLGGLVTHIKPSIIFKTEK